MATLPYQVEVIGEARRDQVLRWCESLWPYTKGATWCMMDTGRSHMPAPGNPRSYLRSFNWIYKFAFQREEDFLLYQLTWE